MRDAQRPSRRIVFAVTVGGSAFNLLRGQLAWFKSKGWDVTLVTTPDESAQLAADREGVDLHGIPMIRGISPGRDLLALVAWIRTLRLLRPDAVNVGSPKAALLGMVASAAVRVPRRLYVVWGLRLEGSTGPLTRLLWAMEWFTMRLATDVLFISPSLAHAAAKRGLVPLEKSWFVGDGSSNGVDADAIAARVAAVDSSRGRAELGLSSDDFVVGFIGRITEDKGIGTLLKAMRDSSLDGRVKLVLVGSEDDDTMRSEMAKLPESVRHVGWTDDVWGYLALMDCLCLPTRREGFPNVVLEAAAAGIPTITTKATGAVDSVLPEVTGLLVDIDDASGLVEQINRLARSADFAADLGRAAQQRARSDYAPERIWTGIQEILDGDPSIALIARKVRSHDLENRL